MTLPILYIALLWFGRGRVRVMLYYVLWLYMYNLPRRSSATPSVALLIVENYVAMYFIINVFVLHHYVVQTLFFV